MYFLKPLAPREGSGNRPRRKVPEAVILALSLNLLSCAGQAPPGGGPPDTNPPFVVRTYPDTNAVRIAPDRIELEFNEYVDRRTVQDAIFFSPPVGELTFDWSGREVAITFPHSLKAGITYVVTVGTDVLDVRGGNRMASAFTLAFSTGDSIDKGMVSGRVVDGSPEGIMIFAYALRGSRPDTLDPSRVQPDYVTQTGAGGLFVLSNLANGLYRIVAVQDEYRDFVYSTEVDRYGVAPSDISLTPSRSPVRNLLFRLAREDTTRPFATSVTAADRHSVEVRFSEPLDSLAFPAARATVRDTLTGVSQAPDLLWLHRTDRTRVGLVFRRALDQGRGYEVLVAGLRDDAGNPQREGVGNLSFSVPARPDTIPPRVRFEGVTDSSRGKSRDFALVLEFSEPVEPRRLVAGTRLRDSSGIDLPFSLEWWNGKDGVVRPDRPYDPAAWYSVSIEPDSISDFQGNRSADSTVVVRFQTIDPRSAGGVEGSITAEAGVPVDGRVIVTARMVGSGERFARVWRDGPGPFTIAGLPEGRYSFDAFLDSDSTGSFRAGKPFPFVPSARYAVSPDTVRVRARWTVGDVTIPFR